MASSKMESVTQLAQVKQKQAEEALQKGISSVEQNPYMKRIPTEIQSIKFLEFFAFSTGLSVFTSFTYYLLASTTGGSHPNLAAPLRWCALFFCWGAIIINILGYALKLEVLTLPIFFFLLGKAIVVLLILITGIWKYGTIMKLLFIVYMVGLVIIDLLHFRNYTILMRRMASDEYDDNCEKIVRSVAEIV
ncbi:hypothetical protein CDIK_0604 [Cucumispora dikerogammari]|nr:hypothetical protein CDIK_0604 [Cucumispora dikerogammari]